MCTVNLNAKNIETQFAFIVNYQVGYSNSFAIIPVGNMTDRRVVQGQDA